MLTIKQIHSALMEERKISSLEACELIGSWVYRAPSTVYGWIGNRPPDENMVLLLNIIYKQRQAINPGCLGDCVKPGFVH